MDIQNDSEVREALGADNLFFDEQLRIGDTDVSLNGDRAKATGEFGTVEQANEDDAVVKWDDDGRVRLRQPWLKKVVASTKPGSAKSEANPVSDSLNQKQ